MFQGKAESEGANQKETKPKQKDSLSSMREVFNHAKR